MKEDSANKIVRERIAEALAAMDNDDWHLAALELQSALFYASGAAARRQYERGYDDAKKIHGVNGGL